MRLLMLTTVLALTLAGCTVPVEEEGDPLFGVCPQWQEGAGESVHAVDLSSGNGTTASVLVDRWADDLYLDGDPLDMYRFRLEDLVIEGGALQVRVFAEERQIGIHDFRDPAGPRLVPVLTLDDAADVETQEFQAILSPVEHGSDPAPSPVRFEFRMPEGQTALSLNVTAHYRVCGAVTA